MKLTCSKCFGNKTYRGMGSIIVKCDPCGGNGFIEVYAEPVAEKEQKKSRKGTIDEKASTSRKTG